MNCLELLLLNILLIELVLLTQCLVHKGTRWYEVWTVEICLYWPCVLE